MDSTNETEKKPVKKHPFVEANIFSKIFFLWMLPLFVRGFKKGLAEDDLYPSLKVHDSKILGDKLEKEWFKEVKKNPSNPSLWRALVGVFGKELALLGLCYLIIEIFIRLGQPLCLSQLLHYYEPNTTMSKREAYYYASGIALTAFLSSSSIHSYMLRIFHLGARIRIATSTLVYRKALRLSKGALAETTVGQMVNLISNDVGRFDLVTNHIHNLWLAPVETIVVLLLIYFSVGFTGVIGVALLLSFIPFQMWLGKRTSVYRLATALRTDERIRLMNEIVSGIQVIKMYTWEIPFAKLVEISRRKEINEIMKISVIKAIMMSFNLFLNRVAICLCVLVYFYTGNVLDAQYVYVVSSFYAILRGAVTMFFPQGVTQFAEANISVQRLKKFLLYDEVNFDSSATFFNALQSQEQLKSTSNGTVKSEKPCGIHLNDAAVKWLDSSEDNSMEHLNVNIESAQLAAVIGPVGSGKTTLLHAILGELQPVSGSVEVTGKVSYASQEPWLFVGSVRQNITFGQAFNAKRYYDVVRVCALERDFRLFPYGDRTIVGERGVSLSGGQRARINLARAVYKQADIYLLDDPLSAVDAHVGKQIFEECITGYLKNKCVVLVTHQLQYLTDIENIYLLGNKTIEHSGTYEEIQNSGKAFTELLTELKKMLDEDEEEVDDDSVDEIKPVRRKRASTKELVPINTKSPEMEKESRGTGNIGWPVYKSYFVSGGHWCKIMTLFIVFVLAQALGSIVDYFLTVWVNMNQIKRTEKGQYNNSAEPAPVLNNSTVDDIGLNSSSSTNNSSQFNHTPFQDFWFTYMTDNVVAVAYSALVLVVVVLTISRSIYFYRFCNKASIRLHNNMFYKIVYATMRFFNTNPSGRILNRFSKDMNQVDEVLPFTLLDTLQISLTVCAISVVIASVNPWVLLPTVIMLIIFYFLRVVYLATSRDVKRLEGIKRSPVYSHLTASLQGLTTIRAFGAQEILKAEFDSYQNAYSSAYFMFLGATRTFGFWLDMHCVAFIALVTFSFLFFDTESFGGNVGLAITQSLNLTGMFQWGMRQWSELENIMTCVERIKEYADVVPERDENATDHIISKSWPTKGDVKFEKLNLRYAVGEPVVLKNLTFSVEDMEKVGIVGRTGAGKSSIIMALFRLAINEGKIIIDGVDTSSISLNRLRSSISIIPQEPVLFSGTLRKNLDPFDEYSDEVLWDALEQVELKTVVSDLPAGLESKMSEGGSNFSVGQRQLVCLARAIIRKNKILVLDEATANVDPQTDTLIQSTIRHKFSNCTVLTIAHRLHTIMDSDKVLVMDAGQVVEFGHPYELLQNKKDGIFYGLVQQTGRGMAENLTNIAEESYKKHIKNKTE
ncbi:putative multidrug resistance-associated protein lethal(2)03659 isoform X1 [Rhynchophorus ferrugineus]|uniref:putative multidrug resistance-associated protein lethal(2)03659 isoform X1 n=2 Tax=Rhynchophorus ferrugineus TaxID=354439 RepID=UPI003FCE40C9